MSHPKLIFGAASFGMNFLSTEEVQEVLDFLKQNNIMHLDTAGRYPPTSPGRSEELIGETKAASQGFTIDTKILTQTANEGGDMERSAVERSIETSLRRIGVEQVNTLHIHCPDFHTPLEEQARTINDLYKAGKFKQFGVSNFQPDLLQEFLDICDANGYVKPSVYQGDYSAVNRGMERKLLPILRQHNISYNAFRTLASGFLSGRLTHGTTEGTRFGASSSLGTFMQGLYDQEGLHSSLRRLEITTESLGITTVDAALRWAYYHSALQKSDGIILGASSINQLRSNLESIKRGPLPKECLRTFNEIWMELEPSRGDII
ncbi:aflatoxin B1 aldehyde reductase-like protein [Aspergillus steynii IBT 23096]|uniref:Aflatoxin B1 aldehyde reductase-like protein n=1 Tax=Aspergillus steynii IBT 23096 TaxID=1392250 RepID=A0A2I2GAB7_9EURO|nr:aflatoxin B1 aldehyde reductase-like protein [Aspergillus steynii IBT 23096]PLB49820.1 aflatoxin B1 aldehyde reductase-like protein [Aspergillus steynii IBT 23096]